MDPVVRQIQIAKRIQTGLDQKLQTGSDPVVGKDELVEIGEPGELLERRDADVGYGEVVEVAELLQEGRRREASLEAFDGAV